MDASQFTFDITASGIAYLKEGINLGSASTSGAYWSHAYIGRVYSQADAETVYWTVSGARIGSVAIGPGAASWQAVVTVVHKPPTISGIEPTNATYTEWPGAATDPVLNPHTVGSGTLFQFNGAAWYVADIGFQVNNNLVPVGICGEQNVSKWNITNRDIAVAAVPYEPNLQTYIPLVNTVGTGVLTLATGRTVTFGGLVFYGMRQLPFDPVRPATVSLVGAARTVSLAG